MKTLFTLLITTLLIANLNAQNWAEVTKVVAFDRQTND